MPRAAIALGLISEESIGAMLERMAHPKFPATLSVRKRLYFYLYTRTKATPNPGTPASYKPSLAQCFGEILALNGIYNFKGCTRRQGV